MSRGGRGGGRGGFRGRGGGFGGGSSMPPMGLTFADIQALSREGDALYPPLEPLPFLGEYTPDEEKIVELQIGFAERLRKSPYYVVEPTRTADLERYSDKYRPTTSHTTLKRKDLHAPFFPAEILEGYFNPKTKRKRKVDTKTTAQRLNLDELGDDAEEDKSDKEHSDAGSQAADSDYDVDEEYDNDYAENYFDNGEGDDMDDLGGGGGGEEGGGGGDYE
ncbi:DNA-directed RNA polymerase III, subunit Rpc31 [Hygrophoropsis aurantiaca]|uniref:DNA-directed RNA polymerase III, subunit Rpc31 n=1 Tax=Hygrophoropsis aurantiaca TaxID=72124 RepID=A0ACB8A3S2_9AGAM|nr:DNA-directed RNA polymerase III, subunit Rpc31 [Hygrophoropsis aurantiaca]